MPFDIDYGSQIPMGFAAAAAAVESPSATVRLSGFVSSEDGDELVTCLEGISDWVLNRVPAEKRILESQVDHVLLLVSGNGKAKAYINELELVGQMRLKTALEPGASITVDDVADVHEMEFSDVDIPADVGLVILLSIGWRKGLFFDFAPIAPHGARKRTINPKALLAQIYTYLAFQERLKISEQEWEELFRQGWFPFIGLSTDQLRAILTQVRLGRPIDPLLDGFAQSTKLLSKRLRELIIERSDLRAHSLTLTKSLSHFEAGDYLSCTTMLFPRIEGVMRDWKRTVRPGPANQKTLSSAAVTEQRESRHALSLMLPQKFQQFLVEVYFAQFDPDAVEGVSRNTVAHGVAREDQFNLKSALLGVLILDQLVRLITPPEVSTETDRPAIHP